MPRRMECTALRRRPPRPLREKESSLWNFWRFVTEQGRGNRRRLDLEVRRSLAYSVFSGTQCRDRTSYFGRQSNQVPPALCDATTASPLNRFGRAYLRSSAQAALDQPIGYQLLAKQVDSANRMKNGCDRSDCQGWRERQSSRK